MRVRLLGENLIAFRDTSGKVGLLQNACPHRGASLFYARNEQNGLRCVYHGWKFNIAGKCLEMPLEPAESTYKDRVRATAYPTVERGGIVWAYMGSRTTPPPLPELEATQLDEVQLQLAMRECNWVQAMEADLDTGHVGFLHWGSVRLQDTRPGSFAHYAIKETSPRYHVVNTEYGTLYGAYRPAEEDLYYWRIGAFLFPFYTMVPVGVLGLQVGVRCYVPLDDEHTMVWNIEPPPAKLGAARRAGRAGAEFPEGPPPGHTSEYLPNTSDWLGRWRYVQNPGQRLPDRSQFATYGQLHRDPRCEPAGSRDHRKHGSVVGQDPGTSRHLRPYDRPHPPAAAAGHEGVSRRRDHAARRGRSRRLSGPLGRCLAAT